MIAHSLLSKLVEVPGFPCVIENTGLCTALAQVIVSEPYGDETGARILADMSTRAFRQPDPAVALECRLRLTSAFTFELFQWTEARIRSGACPWLFTRLIVPLLAPNRDGSPNRFHRAFVGFGGDRLLIHVLAVTDGNLGILSVCLGVLRLVWFGGLSAPVPSDCGPVSNAVAVLAKHGLLKGPRFHQESGHIARVFNLEQVWEAILHRLLWPAIAKDSGGEVVYCPVCLEAFVAKSPGQLLPCFHRFHVQCLSAWLAKKPQCPVCRLCVFDMFCGSAA
jgi:hypothetical protein